RLRLRRFREQSVAHSNCPNCWRPTMQANHRSYQGKTPSSEPTSPLRGTLSTRELEVAMLAFLSDSEIGRDLGISICTVRSHLASVRRKHPKLETKADIAIQAD